MRERLALIGALVAAACSSTTDPGERGTVQLPAPQTRVVAAGFYHTCSLSTSGVVTCWGNARGSGGADASASTRPHAISTPALVTITAGNGYTCGLTSDGQAYCWGSNFNGQLGDGTRVDHALPRPVNTELRFRELSAGGGTTCGIAADGRTYCWGDGSAGGVGDGLDGEGHDVLLPSAVAGSVDLHAIASGFGAACGIGPDSSAYCWGAYGSFPHTAAVTRVAGDSVCSTYDSNALHCTRPTIVPGGVHMTQVSVGGTIDCGLALDGHAVCWGNGESGQLGNGSAGNGVRSQSPVVVSGGLLWTVVSVGGSFVCGVSAQQAAYCWGNNFRGYLGNGSGIASSVPSPVVGGLRFVAISASLAHVCGVTVDQRVYCWGADLYGELGRAGSPSDSNVPIEVSVPQGD